MNNTLWDFFLMSFDSFVGPMNSHFVVVAGPAGIFSCLWEVVAFLLLFFYFLWIIGISTVCDKRQRWVCLSKTVAVLNCWTLPWISAAELGLGTRKTIPCGVVLVRNRENNLIENRSLLQNSFSTPWPLSCSCRWGAQANNTEYILVFVSVRISTCSTRCVITKSQDHP